MAGSYSVRLTSRSVQAIKPNGTDFDVRDTDLRGFHVRVTKAGEMIYRFQYRRLDGSRPVLTLGRTTELTPDQARKLASDQFREVSGGADPRKAREAWKVAPTMQDLWTRYEAERLSVKNRPRTQAEYRRKWTTHARPHLGGMKVTEVSRADLRRVVAAMGTKRTTANRVLALLSVMFAFAMENELRTDNPAANMEKYRENTREVVFTDAELSRIAAAIATERQIWARTAITLLIVTGARLSEVLGAEWSELHLEGETPFWTLPPERMKGGRGHIYSLDQDTVDLIRNWRSDAPFISPRWVFPNVKGTGPKSSLRDPWGRVKAAAGLTRGVLHSFRHTYLTRLAESGASAIEIRQVAGHADIATSMKYVHAAENARLRELQARNRQGIREAMRAGQGLGEVVAWPTVREGV
jgi:integrase